MTTLCAALATQTDLENNPEHCSLDPTLVELLGHDPALLTSGNPDTRFQLRVVVATGYALYTVTEAPTDDQDTGIVRMGIEGWARLGLTSLPSDGLAAEIFDLKSSPDPSHEFTEHVVGAGQEPALVVIAPHGGRIEPYTDLQAEHVVWQLAYNDKAARYWGCKGYRLGSTTQATSDRWHITSTDISRRSFPLLDAVMSSPFAFAISFHGFQPEGDQSDILIGGGAAGPGPGTLKQMVCDEIAKVAVGAGFSIDFDASNELGGAHAHNIVNRLAPLPDTDPLVEAGNGIQIEQSYAARSCCWREIARAVTRVFEDLI